MPSGRKSLRDEIKVISRYNELSEPYFKFLKQMIESKNKEDQKWAAERLDKAFVKMIPQTLQGDDDGGPIQVKVINYGSDPSPSVHAEGISATSPTRAGFRV